MDFSDSTGTKIDSNFSNRGRGTKQEEQIKEKRAKEFFDSGLTAEQTCQQPNTPGRNKCYRLFKKWQAELIDSYDYDTNERQIMAKQKFDLVFARLIFKLEYQLNKFENLIENHMKNHEFESKELESQGKTSQPYEPKMEWEYMYRNLILRIAELHDAKCALIISPTVHETSEETMLKYLEKKQERWSKVNQNKFSK